jgi:hypothetical protein
MVEREREVTKMKYEELLKEIEKENDANGVQCLLEAIYGENKGDKLFNAWMKGNEANFKRLVEEA